MIIETSSNQFYEVTECDSLRDRPEIEVTFDEMAAFWTHGREGWQATFGGYDLDCTIGTGATPLDAIVDLLDQVEDQ